MKITKELVQVKQDIKKARQSYEKMLDIDNPLNDIAPVDIDIVPLSAAMQSDDNGDKKNKQD